MGTPYKAAIMREENTLNEESIDIREEIIKFLYVCKCRNYVSEVANGSNIDLDKLPENTLKQLYYLICKKLELPIEEFNY